MAPRKPMPGEVTDKQGRRRFHGAFTGGFSAGYYNTVGSEEGWTPSTFQSSRSKRAKTGAYTQRVADFADEEDGVLGAGSGNYWEGSERRAAAAAPSKGSANVLGTTVKQTGNKELIDSFVQARVGKVRFCFVGFGSLCASQRVVALHCAALTR